MTRIWFIGDTHCKHNYLEIPEGIDIVCCCGDFSNNSKSVQHNLIESIDFLGWFALLEIPCKILIPGNHDLAMEQLGISYFQSEFPSIDILNNESVHIYGIHFYGSPIVPQPPTKHRFPFARKRNQMKEVWDMVPNEVDVLLTHGPPKGILDLTYDYDDRNKLTQVGCKSLLNRVNEIQPKIHAFGHIHNESNNIINFGSRRISNTEFLNCSCAIQCKNSINQGIVVEYERYK